MTKQSKSTSTLQKLYKSLKTTQARVVELEARLHSDIAVIGMACRFPGGADTPEKFWETIEQGLDMACEVPKQRWVAEDFLDASNHDAAGKMYSAVGGFLEEDLSLFDNRFFQISPKEAESLDPQQRLLLEVSWEAFENAGLPPQRLSGSKTGVFVGISNSDYFTAHLRSGSPEQINAYSVTGASFSTATGRLSYFYDFTGPNMAVDTACSSSLVSIHLACQSLRNSEANMVLAGGVNLVLTPEVHIGFSRLKALSPTGRCKSFSSEGDGHSRSEGCGLLVLKRLQDALDDGDPIKAVIKGSAVNQDGKSNGLTAPNGLAQQTVISNALESAGVAPSDVSYVEAHGTGTPLGDPIEMDALNNTYGKGRTAAEPLIVGSVKANIGHLESAAGSASIIKTASMLHHQYLPPQIHFNTPNPEIPWDSLPVRLCKTGELWQSGGHRTAGISSFGFSGTNAHLIMQEAPEREKIVSTDTDNRSHHILLLSAKSAVAVEVLAERYCHYLGQTSDKVADICYTAALGRNHFKHRIAVVGNSKESLAESLRTYLDKATSKPVKHLYCSGASTSGAAGAKPVFLFSGQGSQYQGMGRDLYESQPVFRETLDHCNQLLLPLLEKPLVDVLYDESVDGNLIHQTAYTQVVIFSVEYALAQLWLSWGVRPAALIGHSIGEYVAACIAGIFSVEDALKLVAGRGKLVQSLPANGGMAALIAKENIVRGLLQPYLDRASIAAVNAPENIVISGEATAVAEILNACKQQGIPGRALQISHALHSPMVEPILNEFRELASEVTFHTPKLPIVSNVTGKWGGEEMASADYWTQHMRSQVQFSRSLQLLEDIDCNVFLEIGATSTLISLGMQSIPDNEGLWLPSLGMNNMLFNMRPQRLSDQSDWQPLLESLAQYYVKGYAVDWQGFEQACQRQKVTLPNYPFQRSRHWLQPVYEKQGATPESPRVEEALAFVSDENPEINMIDDSMKQPASVDKTPLRETVLNDLSGLITKVSGFDALESDLDTSFLELGFDSLMMTRFMHALRRQYDMDFEISWFFGKADTLEKVTAQVIEYGKVTTEAQLEVTSEQDHGDIARQEVVVQSESLAAKPAVGMAEAAQNSEAMDSMQQLATGNLYQQVVKQQLQLMKQQLDILQQTGTEGGNESSLVMSGITREATGAKSSQTRIAGNKSQQRPHLRAMRFDREDLTEQQQSFLKEFCQRYQQRTEGSKAYVIQNRTVHVDWINSLNFRPLLKEVNYPIVHERSAGSRIHDIDGNEYINIGMGYGVSFFGINPPFIKEVLHDQIDRGYELGPQCATAGEVAQLVHELTGVERVTFCNTGSEAVMVALRVARTVTERRKVVMFAGSYHGSFDGILAETTETGTLPTAPGTTPGMVEDVLVLNYDTEEALSIIREQAHELAAVLVEPVQSRKPSLQPREFLQQIREITEASGTALIFDEVLTGFRINPGGCQHHFDITADLVTYGKILGGGLPLAAVAGKAKFMDAVDGGHWEFGDDSYPASNMTVFAGTYCKHPLALRVAKACLEHMKLAGPALQEKVNQRTAYFANTLNAFFEEQSVAIKISWFSSVFRFESFGKYSLVTLPIEMELLFLLLLEKGVYTWERRICFFSTAISDADVEHLITHVKDSIIALRRGGFMLESKALTSEQLVFFTPAKQQIFPQSSVQRRLYVLSDIDGDANGYRMAQAFSIKGAINQSRMQRCLDELIARHAIFRTAFCVDDNGELVQQVQPQAHCEIRQVDSKLEQLEADIECYDTAFDLSLAPILRVVLFRLSPNKSVLVFYSHHILFDGLSWNLFISEFNSLYAGKALPKAPTSKYTDYIAWQSSWLNSPIAQASEKYWLMRFADKPPVLMLPTDFTRPQKREPVGGIIYDKLGKTITRKLKMLAGKQGLTINMLLLGLYGILLHKLSSQNDMVIGIPTSGRPTEGFDGVMGMFANTMPMRLCYTPEQSFTDFLSKLKTQALADYEHQDYPFENIVDKLSLVRDLSRNTLFDTMFVYEQADERRFRLDDIELEPYEFQKRTALFDLVLEVIDQDGVMQLHLEYSTQLFTAKTMKRWLGYFKQLAKAVTTDSSLLDKALHALPWLPAAEIKLLTQTFNDTTVEYPDTTLTDLFESQVTRTPERIAVYCEGREMQYGELNSLANQIAHTLRSTQNITSDTPVVLLVARSEMMIAGMFGILKAGAAYVPIEVAYPDERVSYIIKDSGAAIVLTETGQEERLQVILQQSGLTDLKVVNTDQLEVDNGNPVSNITSSSLAYILYTSGSTGQPKGVLLEHEMIANMINWRVRFYEMQEDDVILQLASYASDSAVEEIFPQLISGGSTVLFPPERLLDVAYLADLVEQYTITDLIPTPSFYKVFLEGADANLDSLKQVVLMGEAVESDVVKLHFETLPNTRLFNAYGPTENSVNSSLCELFPADNEVLVGKSIDNSLAYVLGSQRQVLATGVPGEICLGGKGVARGYLNRPEETADKFIVDPFATGRMYRTGDLGCWMPDGNLKFLGRIDDQVQIRGNRVEPGEVENRLVKFDQVKDGVVVSRDINDCINLVAYVVGAEVLKIPDLREYLSSHLPSFMVPTYFVLLNALPLNSRGKVDKEQLPLPDLNVSSLDENPEYVAPVGDREVLIASLWAEVLKQDKVGREDDYFSLGGDSIKAIQIISRLRQAGFSLKTRDVFSYPTVVELAQRLRIKTRQSEQGLIEGVVPLTAIQHWFFESFSPKHQAHYTQSILLHAKNGLDEVIVRKTLQGMCHHHDMLRVQYQDEQLIHVNDQILDFKVIDIGDVVASDSIINSHVDQLHSELNFTQGGLFKALFLRDKMADHLILVCHHLLIDAVSWQVFLEDFADAYQQIQSSGKFALPLKTDSFKHWAQAIQAHANSPMLLAEQAHWEQLATETAQSVIATDYGVFSDTGSVYDCLSAEDTRQLLTDVHQAYNTQVNDVLLSALAWALQKWHGGSHTLVALEGHGRESLPQQEIDVSRTVGWFTSEYPVYLSVDSGSDVSKQLVNMKESLRSIPNQGIGYGILRHVHGLNIEIDAQVGFNYLGQFEDMKNELFEARQVRESACVHPHAKRPHALDIEALVLGGQLKIRLDYNKDFYTAEEMMGVLASFHEQLLVLLAHCIQRKTTELTPSDFTYSGLSVDELEDILA